MANAGDPGIRKSSQLNRLRHQLRKKREALADHFDYKMYMIFHFKEQVNFPMSISSHLKRITRILYV